MTIPTLSTILLIAGSLRVLSQSFPLTPQNLQPINTKLEETQYNGKKGIRVTGGRNGDLAIVKGTNFKNGTIEIEVSGNTLPDADTTARGFVGVAFRLQNKDTMKYECFYLRPTNGRSSDQLRRNHSTQYTSEPDFPWFKLRKESPGLYESYVDLVPGAWTKIKITVKDRRAKLFVNGADQPCLVVSDLKKGITTGSIALWIGIGTEGYFRELKVVGE